MTTVVEMKTRVMPKGGKKGGTMFPRTSLADALVYAKKLVGKTHTGPQPTDVILMGVIGSKHTKGQLAMSALKQYGLMKGNTKSNFSADDLAKKIVSAPNEELVPLYRSAILKPAVFKALFDTYHGDTVSKAKLKQRAADVKVHPDETGNCVELYISGMLTAGLITVTGEQVTHLASTDLEQPLPTDEDLSPEDGLNDEYAPNEIEVDSEREAIEHTSVLQDSKTTSDSGKSKPTEASGPRAVFNVNVNLDSSLDIEKLQKQLELLKRFGAI